MARVYEMSVTLMLMFRMRSSNNFTRRPRKNNRHRFVRGDFRNANRSLLCPTKFCSCSEHSSMVIGSVKSCVCAKKRAQADLAYPTIKPKELWRVFKCSPWKSTPTAQFENWRFREQSFGAFCDGVSSTVKSYRLQLLRDLTPFGQIETTFI